MQNILVLRYLSPSKIPTRETNIAAENSVSLTLVLQFFCE